MTMDIVDKELAEAARDASPGRFQRRPSDEIERVLTASSASSSISTASGGSANFRRNMSRVSTQNDLERHPTELSRIATQRSQHASTVGTGGLRSRTSTRASKKPLPPFGAGKPYPPPLPAMEEYVVEFDGPNDPMHAQNWPFRTKVLTAAMLGYTTMTAAFTSAIFSGATMAVAQEYSVGTEVGLLGTTFYVLGFAVSILRNSTPFKSSHLSNFLNRLVLCFGLPSQNSRGDAYLLSLPCSDSPSFPSVALLAKISRRFCCVDSSVVSSVLARSLSSLLSSLTCSTINLVV